MNEVLIPILVFLLGIVVGFLDSTVGSGGSISIPSLIFLGFPPQVAIATDRLGSVGQTAAALVKFWKSGKILWRYVPIFVILSLIGTLVGTHILLTIDTKILQKIIGLVLLILLPITFLKKDLGIKNQTVNLAKQIIGLIIYTLLSILNGFLGVGSGGISYYNSLYFFGFTFIQANATQIIPWFLLSVLSLILFTRAGIVDFRNGLFLFLGMVVGGYSGAHIALKKGNLWIKRLFILVVIISCIKLLFF